MKESHWKLEESQHIASEQQAGTSANKGSFNLDVTIFFG